MRLEMTGDAVRVRRLEEKARRLRIFALDMIHTAQSGHPGGSLSAADLLAALYFDELHVDPQNPRWEGRDRFVLSKGHVCPALYAALAMRGFFPEEELRTLRQFHSRLQGHPDMNKAPGIDMSTGSLGQGASCAVGMAIAGLRDKAPWRVYALVGDGECDEGQIWEAAETASKYALDNFLLIVDHNGLQNDGTCDEVMPTRSLREKFASFGFAVAEIDGHNMRQILAALRMMRGERGRPGCIIARTVKGKGVSFMEHVVAWHGMAPDHAQFEQAVRELEGAE